MEEKKDAFKFASFALKKKTDSDFAGLAEAGRLQSIPGIGKFIEKIINELYYKGTSAYYQETVQRFFNPEKK